MKEKNMKNILVDTLNSKATKRNIIDQIEINKSNETETRQVLQYD